MGTVLNHSLQDLSAQNTKREICPLVMSPALGTAPPCPQTALSPGCQILQLPPVSALKGFPSIFFFFKPNSITFFPN